MRITSIAITLLMVLGTVACDDDDDDSSKPTPTKPDDTTSGGKGGSKAGSKAPPPMGGTGSKPIPDAGKPDSGQCPVDTSTAEQRFEQLCKKGQCPMTLDDLPTFLDDDGGCEPSRIECCGIVTVTQVCHLFFQGWTFDRETKRLIGVAADDDVQERCEGDHTGGIYVRDCDAARKQGMCDGMDAGD